MGAKPEARACFIKYRLARNTRDLKVPVVTPSKAPASRYGIWS